MSVDVVVHHMDAQDLQRLKNKYDIIGNDAALSRALETAVAVAPTDLTVLITGESGTGKENIPKIIHQNSRRKNGRYLAVNCGGIPEGTINSELFGHEKGSFTGATETRRGYFEEADGGTLFLDEVGELPLSTQAMLLRVLQNGEIIKVGSSKVEKTDVRVIAATHVDLRYAVAQGKFREDLFYRLNAIEIKVPSLRERKDDIYLLFRKFASDFSAKYLVPRVTLAHDAIPVLQNYRWPGNIRQLKNVTESICAMETLGLSSLEDKREINVSTLRSYIPKDDPTHVPALAGPSSEGMNASDRQMFIKAILDIKQEIEALKTAVFGTDDAAAQPRIAALAPVDHEEPEEVEWQEAEVAQAERGNEPLSLRYIETENIRKALERHNGNRKLAARELGISERTLYRRLSEKE